LFHRRDQPTFPEIHINSCDASSRDALCGSISLASLCAELWAWPSCIVHHDFATIVDRNVVDLKFGERFLQVDFKLVAMRRQK